MRLRNAHTVLLASVSAISFAGLIYYQYTILDSQKKLTERQLENNMTAFNVDLRQLTTSVKSLKKIIHTEYQWTYNMNEELSANEPVYEFIYQFDSLYRVYGLKDNYKLSGIITSSNYCQVEGMDMGRGIPSGKSSFINKEQSVVCLCHLSAPLTFDFGYTILNNNSSLISYKEPTVISIILVTVIFTSFVLTMYALSRQKKISELRESFVNTLSHNFETPIFSINIAVQSLRKILPESTKKQAAKYLELISSENIRLKNYSEKMLHEALIGTEKLELEFAPTDVGDVIHQVIDSLMLIAEQNEISIHHKMDLEVSVVNADKTHLFNTFYNILENAIKYSQRGNEIHIKANNEPNMIVVYFQDYGIGMSPETLKNIFKKYYRGSEVGEKKGFGLGLSYVKRIIDIHNFIIEVKSTEQAGTTVTVKMKTI